MDSCEICSKYCRTFSPCSPKAAAKYLQEIYPEIETWWKEPRRQEVVGLLQERYTGRRVDVGNWWCEEILGLVKGEIQW